MSEIRYVSGSATGPFKKGDYCIAHICNNQGGWGAGFSGALSSIYPESEASYRQNSKELGSVNFVHLSHSTFIANMVAQNGYKSRQNPVPLDYIALRQCLLRLCLFCQQKECRVVMPKIGCGLGGGNWNKVSDLIHQELCDEGVEVMVYIPTTDKVQYGTEL